MLSRISEVDMTVSRSGSVVVITSASHAEGREFEPRPDLVVLKLGRNKHTISCGSGHSFVGITRAVLMYWKK